MKRFLSVARDRFLKKSHYANIMGERSEMNLCCIRVV